MSPARIFRNPWFYTSLVLLGLNGLVVGLWQHQMGKRQPTGVLGLEPGELAAPGDSILLSFSRDMVASDLVGTPQPASWIRVEPTVDLEGVWQSPRTFEARARGGFAMGTEYRLTLSPSVLDRDGFALEAPGLLAFRTPPLRMTGVYQVALTRDWRLTFAVTLNDEVPLEALDRHLVFTDGEGQPVPVQRVTRSVEAARVASEGKLQSFDVRYQTDARRRERIVASLQPGLVGVSGPLGVISTQTQRLDVQTTLALGAVRATMRGPGKGDISLGFHFDVDPRAARPFLRVEPEVGFEVVKRHNSLVLRGSFEPGRRYRVHALAGLPAEGSRFLADTQVRSVRFPELSPSLAFVGEGKYLVSRGSQDLMLRTVNVDEIQLDVYRVFPNNLVHHERSSRSQFGYDVLERHRVPTRVAKNEEGFTRIDLDELLGEERHGTFYVTARDPQSYWTRSQRTVVRTRLGIHVRRLPEEILVWVSRLDDGQPQAGAQVEVLSRKNQRLFEGMTDDDGVLRFEMRRADTERLGNPYLVTAQYRGDLSFLSLREGSLGKANLDVHGKQYPPGAYEAFVYAERNVVRPGESLSLRAIVRQDDGLSAPRDMPVTWQILRPDGREAEEVTTELGPFGTCELRFESKRFFPSGRYRALLKTPGEEAETLGQTDFRVESYLPVTLRVHLDSPEGRVGPGEKIVVDVRGEHLSGGAASGLLARARCELHADRFTHEKWAGFQFFGRGGKLTRKKLETTPIRLDEEGRGRFEFTVPHDLEFASSARAVVTVSVHEVSGRAVTQRLARPVDPVTRYVGLAAPRGAAELGEDVTVECVVIDPQGRTAALDQADARLVRYHWEHTLEEVNRVYRWKSERREEEIERREVALADGRARLTFRPVFTGRHSWIVRAAETESGLELKGKIDLSVWSERGGQGGDSLEVPTRITLQADRKSYRAGEVARVQVDAPIAGSALLTLETDRLHEVRRFELRESSTTLEVVVPRDALPHAYLTLTVVRGRDDSSEEAADVGVPLRAYGAVPLLRDPAERQAQIALELPAVLRPGEPIPLDLQLTDAQGAPIRGEVAVALVDAGILALTPWETPDPLTYFTEQRAWAARLNDLYGLVVPDPDAFLARSRARPGGGRASAGAAYLNPVDATRVRSVSIWRGGLTTDSQGRVATTIEAPDFDGELAVIAVAAGAETVGSLETSLKVRHPVVVELALPRFAAPGDVFAAAVSLRNTREQVAAVTVTIDLDERLRLESPLPGAPLDVAPAQTRVIDLRLAALDVGATRVRLRAAGRFEAGEGVADGEPEPFQIVRETELPVRPAHPPVTESRSLVVDSASAVEVPLGHRFLEGTVEAELVVATSLIPNIEGSLDYLVEYPHGCAEQTASRLVPWIALRGYLKSDDGDVFVASEIDDNLRAGVERLLSLQRGDGGLALWPGGRASARWASLHAASVLLEARRAGYDVPGEHLDALLDYCDGLLARPVAGHSEVHHRQAARIRAFALEVLARADRPNIGWTRTLIERRDELDQESLAKLQLAATLANLSMPAAGHGESTPQFASFVEPPGEETAEALEGQSRELGGTLYSRTRELAVITSALVDLGRPPQEILPYVVQLLERQEDGHYRSTQEDAHAILAFARAASVFPPPAQGCKLRVAYRTGAGDPIEKEIDVGAQRQVVELATDGESIRGPVTLRGENGKAVYCFWKIRGTPTGSRESDRPAPRSEAPTSEVSEVSEGTGSEETDVSEGTAAIVPSSGTAGGGDAVEASDRGIGVRRQYLDRDGQPLGDVPVRRGDTVLVRLELHAPRKLPSVVVVDALPAGLEIENPALQTADGKAAGRTHLRVQSHEMRDDRLVLVCDLDGKGRPATYTYVARAVTPGTFRLPPVMAECMYDRTIRSVAGSPDATFVVEP